jgi:hypothetical protein
MPVTNAKDHDFGLKEFINKNVVETAKLGYSDLTRLRSTF